MASGYWVQQRGEIRGPFAMEELRQLAATRKLRPDDKVSVDQKQWVIASRVPGLMAIARPLEYSSPEDEAKQFRPAPVLDDDEDEINAEYQLSDEPPPPEAKAETPDGRPALPPGTQRFLEIPQRSFGMAVGALIGVLIVLASLPVAGAVDAWTGGHLGGRIAAIPLSALIAALGVFWLGMLGTYRTLELEVQGKQTASLTMLLHFAYVRISRAQADIGRGDRLEKRIKMDSSGLTDATPLDLVLLILAVTCCAMGGVPGLFFWMLFLRDRGGLGTNMSRFRLMLRMRDDPSPLLLHQERVENYFATRYGTPADAEKIIDLLQAAVGELEVLEIEE